MSSATGTDTWWGSENVAVEAAEAMKKTLMECDNLPKDVTEVILVQATPRSTKPSSAFRKTASNLPFTSQLRRPSDGLIKAHGTVSRYKPDKLGTSK